MRTLRANHPTYPIYDELADALGALRSLPYFLFGVDIGPVTYVEPWQWLIPSTTFTSIWTFLILLSTTVIKLLAPLQRFTSWFFDVDKHPVKAIGVVSGALVMIGSLIWTVLRAVI